VDQIIAVHLQTGEVTDLIHHKGSSVEILEDQSNIVDINEDQGIMREKGKNLIGLDVAEAQVEKVVAIMEETTVVVVVAGDEELAVVDQMKGVMAIGTTMETITENGVTVESINKVGTTITSQGTLVENMRAIKDETITMLETKRAVVVVVITSLVVVAANKDLVERNKGSTESNSSRETHGSSGTKENMAVAVVTQEPQSEGIVEEIIKVQVKEMELKNKGMMDG